VARKVWDLTYAEIQAIPLGAHSAAEYRHEVAPTLDALLEQAKGRIKVNIELKYYGDHQPGLARKVIQAVRAHGMLDQVVIQSLEYDPLQEVRKLAPEVTIGYLLSFNARTPARLQVDFLSVEQKRLDRTFILEAHRRGQQVYAWTVDTPKDLERMFDLGIDAVITNQSELARKIRDTYVNRPKPERAVRRIRAWLAT
jgi:glycerophosphoryl diester phosphodiesterase